MKKEEVRNYKKDGDKVSIYCKPYTKAYIDLISRAEGMSIIDVVEMLINWGVTEYLNKKVKENKNAEV